MNKPLIGISSNLQQATRKARETMVVPTAYLHAVLSAGGTPFVLPCLTDEALLHELYQRIDGLVLIGGRDLSPHFYNQAGHKSLMKAPSSEDYAHLVLAKWAVEDHTPFLAICRGHQALNVALGGTLIQDIPGTLPDALTHTGPDHSLETSHAVRVKPGRLASILQHTELIVNSSHHQAVDEPGNGLIPAAWAPDGVVEALELKGHPFGISVQWHPERILQEPGMQQLFKSLMQACSEKDR